MHNDYKDVVKTTTLKCLDLLVFGETTIVDRLSMEKENENFLQTTLNNFNYFLNDTDFGQQITLRFLFHR